MLPSFNQGTNFFDSVETQNLLPKQEKAQTWKDFHSPNESLIHTGSVIVDIPKTDETVDITLTNQPSRGLLGDIKNHCHAVMDPPGT